MYKRYFTYTSGYVILLIGGVNMTGIEHVKEYIEFSKTSDKVPKYVKKQMKLLEPIIDGSDTNFYFDLEVATKIEKVLKLVICPKGEIAGKPVCDTLVGFQWVILLVPYCVRYKNNRKKRRYSNILLKISRKNAKSFITALHILLMMLLLPKFSKFYVASATGALARESFNQLKEFVKASPLLEPHFKCRLNDVLCKMNSNEFIPLNYSNSTLDGRLAVGFIVDECGALPNSYVMEALRSSQVQLENKLGFIISTAYPMPVNPFEDECEYCKKVLDNIIDDVSTFSMIYEPDKGLKDWETDDNSLYQSSPLAVEMPTLWKNLLQKRQKAIEDPKARENFLTKHINVSYMGEDSESFVNVEDVRQCMSNDLDFNGKDVFLGLDLSMSNDNTSIGIVARDEYGKLLMKAIPFVPTDRVQLKSKEEKVEYQKYIDDGQCIACGDDVISYQAVEEYVLNIENTYGCRVVGLGYDRYNCISTAEKLQSNSIDCIEVKQHSSVLHPATKLLQEEIIRHNCVIDNNSLLLINFANSRCQYDTNLNMYVNKKKSRGKIDMVVSIINAMYLLQQSEQDNANWVVQC